MAPKWHVNGTMMADEWRVNDAPNQVTAYVTARNTRQIAPRRSMPRRSQIVLHQQLHAVRGEVREAVFDRRALQIDIDVFDPQHWLLTVDI